jgi:hypothetical protein
LALDATRTILGTYGQIFIDGVWQTNLNHLEATVETQKKELNLSGDLWVRHKKGPLKGTGTMSGFKVTSAMIQRGFQKFEVISKLADPEAYGFERIRLMNVMPDRLQLANFTAGEEVTEEIPFTFEGYELLDPS